MITQGTPTVTCRTKPNQDVVQLLLRLKTYEKEYPLPMFVVRRTTFRSLLLQVVNAWFRG